MVKSKFYSKLLASHLPVVFRHINVFFYIVAWPRARSPQPTLPYHRMTHGPARSIQTTLPIPRVAQAHPRLHFLTVGWPLATQCHLRLPYPILGRHTLGWPMTVQGRTSQSYAILERSHDHVRSPKPILPCPRMAPWPYKVRWDYPTCPRMASVPVRSHQTILTCKFTPDYPILL